MFHSRLLTKTLLILLSILISNTSLASSREFNSSIESIYAWQNLLNEAKQEQLQTHEILKLVNDYFNEFTWQSDAQRWQEDDNWSNPTDTILSKTGDCEDLSIAKFVTLLALGFPEQQLHLQYVQASGQDSAHMLLSYTEDGQQYILDSLNKELKTKDQRQDLKTVYHFNRLGVWIPKLGKAKRSNSLLPSWNKMVQQDSLLLEPQLAASLYALL